MNPDNNNPFAVPGTTGTDLNNTPSTDGLSMSDGLASAAENLTSAGLAVDSGPGIMGLDQLGSVRPEAVMAPPEEEPLIPAAPVPGSIGSVTSIPPANPADSVPPVPPAPAAVSPAPEAPAANNVPYNPFAAPATPPAANVASNPTLGTVPPAASTIPNPAAPFQPAVPPKPKMSLLTIILGAVSGVLLITTIVFIVLFIKASNSKKTIYVEQPGSGTSTSMVQVLTCSRTDDFGWLIDEGTNAPGSEVIELSYSNNLLRGLTVTDTAQFADAALAETARANLEGRRAEFMGLVGGSLSADYSISGSVLTATMSSNDDSFKETDGAMVIYGSEGAYNSTTLDTVRGFYEGQGYNCDTSK